MIRCEDFTAALYEFTSGELAPDRQRAMDEHLRACPQCAGKLAAYRQVMLLGSQLPRVAPPHRLLERFRQAAKDQAKYQ